VKKSFVETDRASQLHVLACTAAHRVSAGLTWRPHACTTLSDDVSPRAYPRFSDVSRLSKSLAMSGTGLQHALLLLGETAGQTVAGSFEGCALS